MKYIITFIALVVILFSCSTDNEVEEVQGFNNYEYPQKWELVSMSGQLVGSVRTGEDMDWQEFYLLKSDSTFLRRRENEEVIYEEFGTFSFNETQYEELLVTLTYDRSNDLVGSCYGSKREEVLFMTSNNTMQNTWNACDGLGLEYKRVE